MCPTLFPPLADRIGADNVTVESASIDNAVESLKKLLPGLQADLLPSSRVRIWRETVLAVLIPSEAYRDLTTELVNHGAIAGARPVRMFLRPRRKAITYCYTSVSFIPVDSFPAFPLEFSQNQYFRAADLT